MIKNNLGKELNDKFILAIQKNIPADKNIVDYLCNVLQIGKDSVYRRLKGNINFTFNDVAKVALSLNISVDEIFNIEVVDKILLELTISEKENVMSMYKNKIQAYADTITKLIDNSSYIKCYAIFNSTFPLTILDYENIYKFYLYKWLYQMECVTFSTPMSTFEIPLDVFEQQNRCIEEMNRIPHLCVIVDRNLYHSTIKDIIYFSERKLITKEEIALIKKDLLHSIQFMESATTQGKMKNGSQIDFYLSSIDIGSSYMFYETDNNVLIQYPVYTVHGLESKNKDLGIIQKRWIESFKKYSTCISKSSEIIRFEYFEEQRKIVEKLDLLL